MNTFNKFLGITFLPIVLAGCTVPGSHLSTSDKTVMTTEAADIESQVTVYPLTLDRVGSLNAAEPFSQPNPKLDVEIAKYEYVVGPGDILNITIWDHPELTIPAGSYRSSAEAGNWVHADGTIFYPYIGIVHVEGKNVRQIRTDIAQRLAKYIESPQVDVSVAAFRSKKTYVTGEVNKPGQQAITL